MPIPAGNSGPQPYATSADVAARWRTLTDPETEIADQLCIDASDMIRSRWPDVDSRVTAGTLTAADLTRVVAHMVKRAMNVAVEGFESYTQTAGPFTAGGKVANPNANLYFTAEDVRLLDHSPTRRRAFAVDLSSGQRPAWLG